MGLKAAPLDCQHTMKFLPLLTLAVTAVWGQVGKEFQDAELVDLVLPELMIGQGVREGKVLMQHNGPSPPGGSGPHRYVLVVYEQPRAVNARVPRNRAGFKLESFARRNRLGDPVAGNFYYAEKK